MQPRKMNIFILHLENSCQLMILICEMLNWCSHLLWEQQFNSLLFISALPVGLTDVFLRCVSLAMNILNPPKVPSDFIIFMQCKNV